MAIIYEGSFLTSFVKKTFTPKSHKEAQPSTSLHNWLCCLIGVHRRAPAANNVSAPSAETPMQPV
jgi:hypothetical protein